MAVDLQKPVAIITGDIIGSAKLSGDARRSLHQAMQEVGARLQEALPDAVPLAPDIYRGDAWQALVIVPEKALRAGLFYRASLRAHMGSHRTDCRLAMAVDKIDFLPGNRISQGDGPAFRQSGRLMEKMPRQQRMAFSLFNETSNAAGLPIVLQLIDVLAARWSEKQALAVTGALRGWTQETIARQCWPEAISQQAVAQHLERAGWQALESALEYFEVTVAKLITSI